MNTRLLRMRRAPRGMRGIGLLEAIAALTILAVASGMLFSWASQSTAQLQRWKSSEELELATLESLRYLESVNFSQTPIGQVKLQRFELRWRSTPDSPSRRTSAPGAQRNAFDITPYNVAATVVRADDTVWFDFSIRANGVVRLRSGAGNPGFF